MVSEKVHWHCMLCRCRWAASEGACSDSCVGLWKGLHSTLHCLLCRCRCAVCVAAWSRPLPSIAGAWTAPLQATGIACRATALGMGMQAVGGLVMCSR